LESDLAVVEQNHTKVAVGAWRNFAPRGRGTSIFRLADSNLTCPQLPLLLRSYRWDDSGMAISFQPHLFRAGCIVLDAGGDCALRGRTLRARNAWLDRCTGRRRLSAARLHSHRAHARARVYGCIDGAGGHVVVRAIGHRRGFVSSGRGGAIVFRSSPSPAGERAFARLCAGVFLLLGAFSSWSGF